MHDAIFLRRGSYLLSKFILLALIVLCAVSPFCVSIDESGVELKELNAEAFDFSGSLDDAAKRVGLKREKSSAPDLTSVIGKIINAALSLIGVVLLIIIMIGGYKWMMAGGNEDAAKEAKKYISRGIIGVLIVVGAYAISFFVIDVLL